MKYFVTGATGHIGNVIVKKLYEKGHHVTALVLPNDKFSSVIEPYAKLVYGDILDKDFLIKTVKDYDAVFHLAGIIEIGTGNKKKVFRINIEGTKNILETCQKNKIKRLIYTSSVHAFEEAPRGEKMSEPVEFNYKLVKGTYAKSKAIASDLIMNQNDSELETIIVCPAGVIGPYDYSLSNTGQIFIDYMLGRLTAYIEGGYNFVDVRDLAEGIINAAIKGKNKEVYLLSGNAITVKELLDKISTITGLKRIKTKLPRWFILAMSYFAELYYKIRRQKPLFTHYSVKVLDSNHLFSNKKAVKELGFKVRNIDETIKDTLTFTKDYYLEYKNNKWKKKLGFK